MKQLEMDFSAQSRLDAYKSTDKKALDNQTIAILRQEGTLTAFKLADEMGWDITTARPALSRLKKKNLVEVCGRKSDSRSRTMVSVYKLKGE